MSSFNDFFFLCQMVQCELAVDVQVHGYKGEQTIVVRGDFYCCCKTTICQENVHGLGCPSKCDIMISAFPDECLQRDCVVDKAIWKSSNGYGQLILPNQQTLSTRCYVKQEANKVHASLTFPSHTMFGLLNCIRNQFIKR